MRCAVFSLLLICLSSCSSAPSIFPETEGLSFSAPLTQEVLTALDERRDKLQRPRLRLYRLRLSEGDKSQRFKFVLRIESAALTRVELFSSIGAEKLLSASFRSGSALLVDEVSGERFRGEAEEVTEEMVGVALPFKVITDLLLGLPTGELSTFMQQEQSELLFLKTEGKLYALARESLELQRVEFVSSSNRPRLQVRYLDSTGKLSLYSPSRDIRIEFDLLRDKEL